jgi:hypothetical protein
MQSPAKKEKKNCTTHIQGSIIVQAAQKLDELINRRRSYYIFSSSSFYVQIQLRV